MVFRPDNTTIKYCKSVIITEKYIKCHNIHYYFIDSSDMDSSGNCNLVLQFSMNICGKLQLEVGWIL